MERNAVLVLAVAAASIAVSMSVGAWLTTHSLSINSPATAPRQAASTGAPTPEEIDARIQRLEERLEKKPDDLAGWKMLGRSYMSKGLYMQAVGAYVRAAQMDPRDPEVAGALKELEGMARRGGRHEESSKPR